MKIWHAWYQTLKYYFAVKHDRHENTEQKKKKKKENNSQLIVSLPLNVVGMRQSSIFVT